MGNFYVRPGKIVPQRDEFMVQGKQHAIVDFEFLTSKDKGEDVVAFKRFIVEGNLEWSGQIYPIEMVFNMRSNFIRVMTKGAPLQAEMVAQGLVRDLGRFRIRPQGPRLESGGQDRLVETRYPMVHRSQEMFEFATDDAMWFCAALHDARDRKAGFGGEGSLGNDSPFIG
jgi:hypothetical protein